MIRNVTVELDFDDLDFEDILKYVEEEGFEVLEKKELENMLLKDDKVQKWGISSVPKTMILSVT